MRVADRGWVDWARPMAATPPASTVVETTCSATTKPVTVAGSIMMARDRE